MEVKALSVTNITRSSSTDAVGKEHFRLRIEGFGVGTWDLDLSTRQLEWSDTTSSRSSGPQRSAAISTFLSGLAGRRDLVIGFACEAASSRTRPGPRAIS